MRITQAVILAGGRGTRLGDLTKDTPKAMILINGKPFLEYLICMLKENGIEEIILLLGYLPDKITNYFQDGSKFGIKIRYSIGEVNFDTGKRLKNAENMLNSIFLLMYCDNYWPLNLGKIMEKYEGCKTTAMVTVYRNQKGLTKNNMYIENGLVKKYDKSRIDKDLNCVDIGFIVMKREVVEDIPEANVSLEADIYPLLIKQGQMAAYQTDQRHYTIGTPEKLKLTEEFLKPKNIVLLDRDGVINEKPPKADYVKKWSEFKFLPNSIKGLRLLSDNGYKIIIITNQPGVSRGIMKIKDLEYINKMLTEKTKKEGGCITALYMCLHGWNEDCNCRKPKPGLLFQASDEHRFDLTKTFFIGDDERDLLAGHSAGCKNILITNGVKDDIDKMKIKPDFAFKDLYEAANFVVNHNKQM